MHCRIPVVLLRFMHNSIDSGLHFHSEAIGPTTADAVSSESTFFYESLG